MFAEYVTTFSDKILPPIFPSQIHSIQPELKIGNMHQQQQPHGLPQAQDMHVGSSQAPTEHYINIQPPQSHSPHLPNPSNLSRHITAS